MNKAMLKAAKAQIETAWTLRLRNQSALPGSRMRRFDHGDFSGDAIAELGCLTITDRCPDRESICPEWQAEGKAQDRIFAGSDSIAVSIAVDLANAPSQPTGR